MSVSIAQDYSLQSHNTLRLRSTAKYFARVESLAELQQALAFARQQQLDAIPLGGGSNVVLRESIEALVVQVAISGIDYQPQRDGGIIATVGAGENWHDFVMASLAKGYSGLENLALIPGNVGAAPIQNIGAYGVEFNTRCIGVTAWDCHTDTLVNFDNSECHFAYRNSLFKHADNNGRYFITTVQLLLDTEFTPVLSYQPLREQFGDYDAASITALQVAEFIVALRQQKLPDPAVLPNAGSFFKNPVVSQSHYQRLLAEFPELIAYQQPEHIYKLAAAWLIDRAGWRGLRRQAVGVHDAQALVLVNHGGASSAELLDLAEAIREDIHNKYDVALAMEPTLI